MAPETSEKVKKEVKSCGAKIKDVFTHPIPVQGTTGMLIGLGAGYLGAEYGLGASAAVGVGVLTVTALHDFGYIDLKYRQPGRSKLAKAQQTVEQRLDRISRDILDELDNRSLPQKVADFCTGHIWLIGGFGAGSFLGYEVLHKRF